MGSLRPAALAAEAAPRLEPEHGHEARRALRNSLKLGSSLLITWAVALAVRFLLPRWLGPEQFGPMNFADSFTALVFVALGFGLDSYIRKEVPVRPECAREFFAGVSYVRLAASLLLIGAVVFILEWTRKPVQVRQLVYLFAGMQLCFTFNNSLAALLHAKGDVGGLSVASVLAKLLWGAGILGSVFAGLGVLGVAAAYLGSELIKMLLLTFLAHKHLQLSWRPRLRSAGAVLAASMPFYVAAFAQTATAKVGVTLLSFLVADDRELGWYGAASNLSNIALILTPMLSWVLMPTLSRLAARSLDELMSAVRRAIMLVLSAIIPLSLLMTLGAGALVKVLFGDAFVPATRSVQLLVPTFVLTYLASLAAIALVLLNRSWTVTLISVAGAVWTALLVVVIVPAAYSRLGPGGGATGCALATVLSEAVIAAAMLLAVGRKSFDRTTLQRLFAAGVSCVGVVLLDRALVVPDPYRLLADALAYVVLAVVLGAVDLRELAALRKLVSLGRLR
ncbi:MAG: flippase [Deltaproteobacteria bacterium]|nr:flippase [Deltaproteobacteria bacterium]